MKPANKLKSIVQKVTMRQATPEELERISNLKPPTDRFGKPLRKAIRVRE